MKKILIVAISLFIAIIVSCTKIDNSNIAATNNTAAATNNAAAATQVADIVLENGIFTSGIDFTPGTYTITAIEGNGNVNSSNILDGGINAIMGVGGNGFEKIAQKEYKNIKLPKDVTLDIKNVKVNLKFIR